MPTVVTRPAIASLPGGYTLPPGQTMLVELVSATFDGSGASGAFLPCCSLYAPNGALLGRFPASDLVNVGDSATATFAPGAVGEPTAPAQSGSKQYEVVSAASNNAALIKGSPGYVAGWYCVNTATAYRYVKLFDKASSPTVGTDIPVWVIGIPSGSAANASLDAPLQLVNGIGIGIVVGSSNTDNTAVAAGDVVASIAYL